jgi:hypothetical protein
MNPVFPQSRSFGACFFLLFSMKKPGSRKDSPMNRQLRV